MKKIVRPIPEQDPTEPDTPPPINEQNPSLKWWTQRGKIHRLSPDLPLWERQPNEPKQWYDRFVKYLTQEGIRSVRRVWREQREAKGLEVRYRQSVDASYYKISYEWSWADRAQAWDDENNRKRLQNEAEERQRAVQRHTEGSRQWQKIALQSLQMIAEEAVAKTRTAREKDPKAPGVPVIDDISIMLRAWSTGVEIERKSLGLSSIILELENMSDEQLLARYSRLVERIRGGSSDDETAEIEAAGDFPD